MSFIGWMIVACEIGFWVVITLGFVTRYMLKRPKLGMVFLALTPVIDMLLLIITSIDLYRGATATVAHGIAAVYIGVSLAFGKSMIAWADVRFQYYILKQGQKPKQRYGMEYAHHYIKGFGSHVLAYLIGSALLLGVIFLIQDPIRTESLKGVWMTWSLVLGIDFAISISNYIWPKRAKS
ncbi:hypothetical protein NC661_18055 [Aquibacillus koreensis]|uniref:Integral inner membrane protein n=1 Tax=Aquibacillus koreensis TaxID=279446 RepID=A0A9X4AJH9_9BACI|nr:hypothetical protein [Aquibacillus koreensis]MCT2535422.1 hypothetical protein [Aquibacillus koreensis]MDC3422257.1 hypothetical protein [Aquibacillus koreensis]